MQTALSRNADSNRPSSRCGLKTARSGTAPSRQTRAPTAKTPPSKASSTPSIRLRIDRSHSCELPPDGLASCNQPAVEPAITGNHWAIHAFLQRQLYRPSNAEFVSATQRPGYQPEERLIVKSPIDRSIIAHGQVEPQTIRFGTAEIPVARLRDLAIPPEFRRRGYADRMIRAAEALARKSGAMLMVARGEDYRLLRSHGWAVMGSDPVSIVSPRRLLGQLPAPPVPESPFYASRMPETRVSIGRLTDLESLQSIYERQHGATTGTRVRSRDMWSWLIGRHAHDRIYVYSENSEQMTYVVVRGASILELVDLTEDSRGAAAVVARVAADAIDQGRHSLRIHSPLTDRIHQWADAAGGQVFAAAHDDVWMVKSLSNRTLLRRLAHEMYRRRPRLNGELGIVVGNEELLVRRGVRSMKVTRGASPTHYARLTETGAMQLFLGYRTVTELSDAQELVASNDEAHRMASELFPAVAHWRPRWDDVPVINR